MSFCSRRHASSCKLPVRGTWIGLALEECAALRSAHRQDPGHEAVGDVLQALQDERCLQRALVAVQLSAHLA